jgi:metallophosphoesterase (TIGR00282 family)
MNIKVLMLGDAVGAPGRAMYQKYIPKLKREKNIDFVVVNGENSASDGKGITPKIMGSFKHIGVDVVTSGNHIWRKRDIYNYIGQHKDLLRPANFPSSSPGVGMTLMPVKDYMIGVINLQARVFMRELVDDPFKVADSLLTFLKTKTPIILVDFHGEATSEKAALAYYLDGRVSAVVGTHTHVQTADERILPHKTAFITDLGMAGAVHSLIGMKSDNIIQSMINQMPTRFEVEKEGPMQMTGVCIEIDTQTGHASSIERIKIVDDALSLNGI